MFAPFSSIKIVSRLPVKQDVSILRFLVSGVRQQRQEATITTAAFDSPSSSLKQNQLHPLQPGLTCRGFSSKASSSNSKRMTQYEEQAEPRGEVTVGHKVVQAGRDASYAIILLIGFGITGILVWYIASELLFSFSPNSVYAKAIKLMEGSGQVEALCGAPLKFYGEETSRGRRRHVSYQEYVVNGENYMRVKFYVAGSQRKGTVHADAKETSRGSFQFRFVFVEMQDFPHETVILEDNRREL